MRHIAAFDFDGTITTCDTFIDIIRRTFGIRALVGGLAKTFPSLLRWKLGMLSNSEAKRRLFAHFFAGMPEGRFHEICRRYYTEAWPRIIRPGAKEAIRKHLDAGDTVAIVSASPESWVRPFADALGVDTVLATDIATDNDGMIADRFGTPNCYGQEKVNRLTGAFGPKDTYFLTAYGDSRGDREMLSLADKSHYRPFRK